MAIAFDDGARRAIAHRRAHGHDARIVLRMERLGGRAGAIAGNPEVLSVGWLPHRWPLHTLVARSVDGLTVFMDSRVARYVESENLTVSAWHLGPVDHLTVEPDATYAVQEWERAHRKPRGSASVMYVGGNGR